MLLVWQALAFTAVMFLVVDPALVICCMIELLLMLLGVEL